MHPRGHDAEHDPLTIVQDEVDVLEDTLRKVVQLLANGEIEQSQALLQQTLRELEQQRQREAECEAHQAMQEFDVPWVHTGKFEAIYRVQARSQEEAENSVAEHRLALEPVEVFPLSDDGAILA